jgi:large subunit ribosomal protein L24
MSVKLKKDRREPVRIEIRKNDQVKVISGDDKGTTGRVLSVDSVKGWVFIEHVNMIKKHTKKNPAKQIAGGIAEKEGPVAVSNVMIICGKCGPVRIAHNVSQGPGGKSRRIRMCRKCGQTLDKK